MTFQTIQYTHKDAVAIVMIQRPEKLNALNKQTIEELHEAFRLADQTNAIRCIILTGSGPKAFVAGADIQEFAQFSAEEGAALAAKGQELLFDYIAGLGTPVIAAIHGFALGGGLELALAAHIRVASSKAKLGLPEVSLGLIPGYGGTQRLPELIGKGRALEMILSAGMLDAVTAHGYGLVNAVVEPEDLMSKAQEMAQRIAQNAPSALRAALAAVGAGFSSKKSGYAEEIHQFGRCFSTADFKEGTSAFLAKRKPVF